jgi:carboxymethylenebutenolidase
MDLRSYIESELEEDVALPGGGATATAGGPDGYPGDPAVHVPEAAVHTSTVTLDGAAGELRGYLASPRGQDRPAPAVVVVHENKGLVPYITDVARRLAAAGFVAVAPDLLSRLGGTGAFAAQDEVIAALATIDAADVVADVRATIAWAAQQDVVDADRIAVLGFCYGGGVAWRTLTEEPGLAAGVPFYGPIPDLDDVRSITAPVFAVYGETDQRITSMLPTIREAMERHGKDFEALVVEGAGHAFHNDTNPDRYHPGAARRAEEAAVGWLHRQLGTGDRPRTGTTARNP